MIKLISEIEAEQNYGNTDDFYSNSRLKSKDFPLPVYHTAIYPNLYREEKWFKLFSGRLINNVLSLFTRDKIINSLLEDIPMQGDILQMGICFGDEIQAVAEQVGLKGRFDVIDINNAQITFAKNLLKDEYPQVAFYHYNAEDELPEKYDVVICFMLLHELPIVSKMNVVNNALKSIREEGKVIFVDYGRPNMLHPLAYLIRMFNRLKQPFAEKLWDREIASFAEKDLDYNWKKTKYLGGLYQKVVVTRRNKDQYFY